MLFGCKFIIQISRPRRFAIVNCHFVIIPLIIGIDKYTGEGQITKLDAVKLYAELSKRKAEFDQKIQGMTLSINLKDPTNTVNKIIKMFGFEVKRRQLGEKNNKVRVS